MSRPAVHRSDLARSLRRGLVFLAAAVLGASGLLLTYLIEEQPQLWWVHTLYSVCCWVWVLAGVFAWWRRPGNTLGALLVFGGIALNLAQSNGSANVALATVGAVFSTVILAVTVHLLHAFPSGRLRSRASRVIVAGGYVVAVVLQIPLYAFDVAGSRLLVFVADRPDVVAAGAVVQAVAGAILMISTVVVLAGRLRRAESYQRRVLIPLFGYGIVAVSWIPISSNVLPLTPDVRFATQIVVVAGIPLAFALAVVRGGFARTGELQELTTWLGAAGGSGADLSVPLASVLGDPSLRLVFRVPGQDVYVDATGSPVPLPAPGTHRAAVPIELSGEPIGAIVYDSGLIADPELVRAAGRVVALGVDRERLTAALRVTEQSLRRSRERLVETADRERRRIAQDLHDGLQVQLVLLALETQQLANEPTAPPSTRLRATALRRGIDDAAADLRTLVHAVMPASLVERGLASATEDLVDRVPLPTSLRINELGALPPPVVSTAYFVVAEAVANAVKHAQSSRISVRVERVDDLLAVEVTDDGRGGAALDRGTGLRGLQDRIDVLGGRLHLASPDRVGTRLLVHLPISL